MLIKKERGSLVETGCRIALCDQLHAVIPCRLMVISQRIYLSQWEQRGAH
jgi:hypothetical protein